MRYFFFTGIFLIILHRNATFQFSSLQSNHITVGCRFPTLGVSRFALPRWAAYTHTVVHAPEGGGGGEDLGGLVVCLWNLLPYRTRRMRASDWACSCMIWLDLTSYRHSIYIVIKFWQMKTMTFVRFFCIWWIVDWVLFSLIFFFFTHFNVPLMTEKWMSALSLIHRIASGVLNEFTFVLKSHRIMSSFQMVLLLSLSNHLLILRIYCCLGCVFISIWVCVRLKRHAIKLNMRLKISMYYLPLVLL